MTEELEIYEPPIAPANLFGASNPAEVVARSTEAADALVDVIKAKGLWVKIGPKAHVLVDGWTLLGSMCGVFPVVVWTRKLTDPDGWEARVEARTMAGAIVGAAEAQCTRSEKQWGSRDDYALRSMAQTRATSKALRGPLGFIVHLAGFSATPAEEMQADYTPPPAAKRSGQAKTKKQLHAHLNAKCADLDKEPGTKRKDGLSWEDRSRDIARERWHVDTRADLDEQQLAELIRLVETEAIPFG